MKNTFTGFKPETIQFLKDLGKNNNKPWFEAHRSDYETFLLQPFRNLASDLATTMLGIDKYMEVGPTIGKTISRIYRDTRFSKDKSIFRNRMWLSYKRSSKEWQEAPGFFFELNEHGYTYGMGIYQATPMAMRKFRELLDKQPGVFLDVISFFYDQDTFKLAGDDYKKILNPNQTVQLQQWYQKKSFYLYAEKKINKNLFSWKLAEELASSFKTLSPLYHYLWQLKD